MEALTCGLTGSVGQEVIDRINEITVPVIEGGMYVSGVPVIYGSNAGWGSAAGAFTEVWTNNTTDIGLDTGAGTVTNLTARSYERATLRWGLSAELESGAILEISLWKNGALVPGNIIRVPGIGVVGDGSKAVSAYWDTIVDVAPGDYFDLKVKVVWSAALNVWVSKSQLDMVLPHSDGWVI